MKKCKMCTHIYDDSMGFCPECGALDFEPVAKPAEKKPDPAPATNSYAWSDPRSSSSLNPENKAFEPAKVQEKKPEPSAAQTQHAQNTPASNANNGSCLGTLIKWVFYFFAFFIVIYIITEVL